MTRSLLLALCTASLVLCCHTATGKNHTSTSQPPQAESSSYDRPHRALRLATYNTHHCDGWNEQRQVDLGHYDSTAKVIGLLAPDVIALQELDQKNARHPEDQLQELADRTGMKPYYCKSIDYGGGAYGIGMLCNQTPLKIAKGVLPGVEPRAFMLAEFRDYIFISTHFCVTKEHNRTASVQIINDYIATHYPDYRKPIFLAGDLNTSDLKSPDLMLLQQNWQIISSAEHTYFEDTMSARIDFILLYRGNEARCKVLGTVVPTFQGINLGYVSDHRPVLVDIKKPLGR